MLPGKTYTPEDYLWMVWRRKWLVIVPAAIITAAMCVYTYSLPDLYRSSATVLVVGQQVPENLVRSTVTDTVAERLRAMNQNILTRTRLERIIEEFNLYEQERRTGIMEEIVERMRDRDIRVAVPPTRNRREDASSFTVSFTAENPRTAMRVAERLALLYVQENTQNREMTTGATSQFMEATVDDHRRRMQEQDRLVEEFSRRNAGRLPSQLQSNHQMMQSVQTQIQQNLDATTREVNEFRLLEAQLAEAIAAASGAARAGDGSPAAAPVAQQLEAAKAHLASLQSRRRDDHPDVRTARRLVAELDAKAEEEALSAPLAAGDNAQPAGLTPRENDRLRQLRVRMAEIQLSLDQRKNDDARLRRQYQAYVDRVDATPGVAGELAELMRDQNIQKELYEDALRRRDAARLSESLERRQIAERFQVIDSARLPERPIDQNRTRLNLLGLVGGLGVGLALVALLEYRDTTLKTDSDVVVSLALPVLAVIPAMTNATERTLRKRRARWVAIAASMASLLLVAVAVAWKFRLLQGWIG